MATTKEELFIRPSNLKGRTLIDGNTDTDKLTYMIELAQETNIQNYLGEALYLRMKEGLRLQNMNAQELVLWKEYIAFAHIHYTAVRYYKSGAYTVGNGGMFKRQPQDTVALSNADIDRLVQTERDNAQYYATRMVKYLCDNASLFPQYNAENRDIKPDKRVDYVGGIWLG